jgi:hypothetical protein
MKTTWSSKIDEGMMFMSCTGQYGVFSNDSCSNGWIQDKVCISAQRSVISGESGTSSQLYIANTPIDATGYFKVVGSTEGTATYTLIFLLNGGVQATPVIDPLGLNESIAFTMTDFDEIRVKSSAASSLLTFELSLTPRYTE